MPSRWKQILGIALLIGGLTLCGAGLSLLLKPDRYAATARVKVEHQLNAGPDYSYDPYFIQTEFEIMQSQLVLGSVITNLNLNEEWGRKYYGGKMLKTADTLVMLKNRMHLALVRNTKFFDITVYSDNPAEAAQVANAIATAYGDYQIHSYQELRKHGIEVLQQQFQDQEKPILNLQTNLEQLRLKFGIQAADPTHHLPVQQPYWDETQNLEQLIKLHQLLGVKIEAEKIDLQASDPSLVQIVDLAEPPQSPIGPNRPLGIVFLAGGMALTVTGFLLFQSSRRHPPLKIFREDGL